MNRDNAMLLFTWAIAVMLGIALWRFWTPQPSNELIAIRGELRGLRKQIYDIEERGLFLKSSEGDRWYAHVLATLSADSFANKARMLDAYDPDEAKKARYEMDGFFKIMKAEREKIFPPK
jgi:hypothetical protein